MKNKPFLSCRASRDAGTFVAQFSRFLLSGLLFVLVLAISSCQMPFPDFLGGGGGGGGTSGPLLPYVNITEASSPYAFNYALGWKRGREDQIEKQLTEVYEEWMRFEHKINPLPHFAPAAEADTLDFAVWVASGMGVKLDNSQSDRKLAMARCWPRKLAGTPNSQQAWIDSFGDRAAEFKQVRNSVKSMMESIAASPLLDREVSGQPLLKLLHKRMEDFIAFPSDPEAHVYADRTPWVNTDREAMAQGQYNRTQTGPLFECYFGYMPKRDDYVNQTGSFMFPVE